jgi:tetratricopeptide (TPR) repeat protein
MSEQNKLDPTQELLKKADQLRLAGSYHQARALLEEMIKVNPFFAPAKLGLGRVYFESGDLANARSVLEEFSEFIPDHSLANKILAKIYIYFSQNAKAREKINMVLSTSPDDSMAKKMLQEIEESDSFQEENLNNEDTKKNTAPASTATIAEIYRSQGHLSEALEIYKDLLKQNADHPIYQQKVQDLEAQLSPVSATAETAEIEPETYLKPESSVPEFKRVEIHDDEPVSPLMAEQETNELEPEYGSAPILELQQESPAEPSPEPVSEAIITPSLPIGQTRKQKLERMLHLVQQHRGR